MKYDISCIVLTSDSYSRKFGCIEHTILALLNQQEIAQEIIIVDNGIVHEDKVRLAKFVSDVGNTVITLVSCNLSIAEARNFGAGHAAADLYVFVDEDTILLEQDAQSQLLAVAKHAAYGYGADRKWTTPNWFENHADEVSDTLRERNYELIKAHVAPPDPSIRKKSTEKYLTRTFIGNYGFMSKAAFEHLGGFPTEFKGYGLEDDAFCFLAYVSYGTPGNLSRIEVGHVTHPISALQFGEYETNLQLYNKLLQARGFAAFHIGDLLYPEQVQLREVAEKIV